MNLYYNLPPEQRRVQQIVALFNADEQLWQQGQTLTSDSAEKPLGMLRQAQHERKISNHFNRSSVRPEALEG